MINSYADLRLDDRNTNKGTERGRYMLERSIEEAGLGRSIVVDRNGAVIAGNHVTEVAGEKGMPLRVVQTDGTELVVVQRTDLDLATDARARMLHYYDNRAAEVGLDWDIERIADDVAALPLTDLWRPDELDALLEALGEPEPGASGDGGPGTPPKKAEPVEPPSDDLEPVKLFYAPGQLAEFTAYVEALQARLGHDTMAATVLAVLQDAYGA